MINVSSGLPVGTSALLLTKVKICGLSRRLDIEIVNIEKPDYVGFVFAESKRKVTPEQAAELRAILQPGIIPVGVFVNEPIMNVVALLRNGVINLVQLHGREDEEYIEKLKDLTDKPIIKANRLSQSADFLLFDSPEPGSGQTFDWDSIGKVNKPYFLAGGLNSANVTEAVRKLRPFAVDVSSGVETDGVKDAAKIKALIAASRSYF